MIVVIPVYGNPSIVNSLSSIEACFSPNCSVEVILVYYHGKSSPLHIQETNSKLYNQTEKWIKQHAKNTRIRYHFIQAFALPSKHMGVGLARKIGMDEAIDRFEQAYLGEETTSLPPSLIILSLDAGALVAPNYLVEVRKHFAKHKRIAATSINFQLALKQSTEDPKLREAALYYELLTRYHIQGLRYAGHPHAFHTLGSAMAVRAIAYQAQNGMNRRKANEAFHFLHKFSVVDQLSEVLSTQLSLPITPVPHIPLTPGYFIHQYLTQQVSMNQLAFHYQVFEDIKHFLQKVPEMYTSSPSLEKFSEPMQYFLQTQGFLKKWEEIQYHVTSYKSFYKRFFRWFSVLKALQYMHFARDHFSPNQPLPQMAHQLLALLGKPQSSPSLLGLLNQYRTIQCIISSPDISTSRYGKS